MNDFLLKSKKIYDELVSNRRIIHEFAEIGFELPNTIKFAKEKLIHYGLNPKDVGKAGVSCIIGNSNKGKTVLLRCDMDALPMKEESNLPFSAKNGHCHSCGHDFHTAMLLGAAKILKAEEDNLNGAVKLVFQPAEELLAGANDLIENGILDNPKVDASMAIHMALGTDHSEIGKIYYAKGASAFSGDAVKIVILGKAAHGSKPETGIDAINVAAHMIIAFQEIISREISCRDNSVILVGKINGGDTCNTVAGRVELEVSIRTTTEEKRQFLKERVEEVAKSVATTFRAIANVEFVYGIDPMITDIDLSEKFAGFAKEVIGKDSVILAPTNTGTEDFSVFSKRVPSVYLTLGSGSINQGYELTLHNPKIILNEECLPIGTAIYVNCAFRFLQEKY